tara:strand:- start:21 stop:1439 length:1419 start_codon:yes stop_codon:yes gene_type:complete
MIGNLRNFAKTKFAGLLVFIMIIPFVFWGMGSMFSSGNTNNLVKINKTNISTQEFIDYLNSSGIPQQSIKDNLKNNIIEELLSNLISSTLLDLEIKHFNIIISENTLLKKIKDNKNFHDENGNFERIKYEKFLLENNQSAPIFEQRLKNRELQKNLFDYIGAGTVSPQFLINRLYEEENKKLEVEFIDLINLYKKKDTYTDADLTAFLKENENQLKVEYIDFSYLILNPKNLIGSDEFNQSFFDKIDQIEVDISNEVSLETIAANLDVVPIKVTNFKFSSDEKDIEKKIFELRNSKFDIFENNDDYVLYEIKNTEQRKPNLNDIQTKNEIIELIFEKDKFDYNKNLIEKISNKKLNDNIFLEMGQNQIQTTKIKSIKDNNKFEINSIKILYSLPLNSFTLISDENNNIYLAKIKKIENEFMMSNQDELKNYTNKHNSKNKSSLLKSYDILLNNKYDVVLNQKTIERVKNFFQ